MANAVWPAGLPQAPQLRELRESLPRLVVRSGMDVGPDKVRRRLTAGVRLVSIELKLTRTQCALLDEFFVETCLGGAEPFDWKNHRTGADATYRFLEPPVLIPLAPRQSGTEYWVARFELEMLPATVAPSQPQTPGGGPGGGQHNGNEPGGGIEAGAPEAPGERFEMPIVGFLVREADAVPPSVPVLAGWGSGFTEPSAEGETLEGEALIGEPIHIVTEVETRPNVGHGGDFA